MRSLFLSRFLRWYAGPLMAGLAELVGLVLLAAHFGGARAAFLFAGLLALAFVAFVFWPEREDPDA